ncbi:phosphotransferase [Streptomyces sp. FH025]|uniref:phosphotransferase n=1 Tax=Streptomyces sp. FH025 TaxID=2815937 RepID=UPI001FAF6264|nr:phosphotransferase [Streptomyces sp. FH025]
MRTFTKTYADPGAQQQALAHHRWIARVNPDVRIPEVIQVIPSAIDFEHIDGRHGGPDDLATLAALLGHQHTNAYTRELHTARLNAPHTSDGITIAGFADDRRERLHQLLASGAVPGPALTRDAIDGWLERAATMPAAFYKDANPRNFLITGADVTVIDFDSLTLAPFGYDLAKLVVSTAMTTGSLPEGTIRQALDAYNHHPRSRGLPGCPWHEFAAWCEFHHALTAPYLGTNNYRFSWHTVRPAWTTDILRHFDKESAL